MLDRGPEEPDLDLAGSLPGDDILARLPLRRRVSGRNRPEPRRTRVLLQPPGHGRPVLGAASDSSNGGFKFLLSIFLGLMDGIVIGEAQFVFLRAHF